MRNEKADNGARSRITPAQTGSLLTHLEIETINDQVEMFQSLLTWWGGEAMYMLRRCLAVCARLREFGRPWILVAAIDLSLCIG